MRTDTFIDPENYAYPAGSIRQSRRRFRAVCDDGIVRSGVCGIPDTFFSIPARIKARGKTVAGFVTRDENGLPRFIAYSYRKNGDVIPRAVAR